MAKHNQIGEIGENIMTNFLIKKGFEVICRNYRKKWGEIDIIAEKDKVLHFVEVKTVSRKSFNGKFHQEINSYQPEDNMHPWKLQRLRRAVQTYLMEKHQNGEPLWQFDLACVFLDVEAKVAKVKFMQNLIL
ncbi:MAG: YraN family protein [Parcubacteria group bacterium]|jgi:putative endonuclease|nr:YraN family protein [Parcubacteria group bacterium]